MGTTGGRGHRDEAGAGGGSHRGFPRAGAVVPDPRLPARTPVLGVATEGAAVAYPQGYVTGSEVINDRVGDPAGTFASDRRLDGRPLTLGATATAAGDVLLADGSRWSVTTGRALGGPHGGRRPEAVPGTAELYWFAWAPFHPGTRVWRP